MIPGSTNQLLAAGVGYQISRSVRLRSSASAYFNRTFGAGNQQRWTKSFWMKRGTIGAQQNFFQAGTSGTVGVIYIPTANTFNINLTTSGADTLITNQVFRDTSAWYHVVIAVDTTQATASNRCLLYVNGIAVTSFASTNYPALNSTPVFNSTGQHSIGLTTAAVSGYFDGYLTEINFIDGQALTPSSFGETNQVTGVWQPKKYTGTYGTNGFYLNFSDNSNNTAATIGKDYSGNGNNWTPNNISVTAGVTYDSMLDVPTQWADGGNGRGNYCVMNPLRTPGGNGAITQGNLYVITLSGDGHYSSTIAVTSGKWYAEFTPTFLGAAGLVGLVDVSKVAPSAYPNSTAFGWTYISTGNRINNNVSVAYGATWAANDVIGVAYDADAGTVTFYKNGVSQGQAYSGITGDIAFCCYDAASANYAEFAANFGQRPFAFSAPSGFKALNTLNLP